MIAKLIFTAVVIAGVWIFFKYRNPRPAAGQPADRTIEHSADTDPSWSPRVAAYVLVAAMLLMSGVIFFLEWRDNYQVINIRVINTNTGDSVVYQARKGDVDEKSFETTDGRRIILADVERMEVGVEQ